MDNFKSKQGGFCLLKAKDLIPPLLWKTRTGAQVLQPSTRLSRGSGLSTTESSAGWKQPLRSLSPRQQQVSLTAGLPAHLRKANRSKELPQKPAASDLYSEGAEKKHPQKVAVTRLHHLLRNAGLHKRQNSSLGTEWG